MNKAVSKSSTGVRRKGMRMPKTSVPKLKSLVRSKGKLGSANRKALAIKGF